MHWNISLNGVVQYEYIQTDTHTFSSTHLSFDWQLGSGVLYSWGNNTAGQCGLGRKSEFERPSPVSLCWFPWNFFVVSDTEIVACLPQIPSFYKADNLASPIVHIAASSGSLAVTNDESCWVWGFNQDTPQQLRHFTSSSQFSWFPPSSTNHDNVALTSSNLYRVDGKGNRKRITKRILYFIPFLQVCYLRLLWLASMLGRYANVSVMERERDLNWSVSLCIQQLLCCC